MVAWQGRKRSLKTREHGEGHGEEIKKIIILLRDALLLFCVSNWNVLLEQFSVRMIKIIVNGTWYLQSTETRTEFKVVWETGKTHRQKEVQQGLNFLERKFRHKNRMVQSVSVSLWFYDRIRS